MPRSSAKGPIVYLAIDPSVVSTGLAWCTDADPTIRGVNAGGIEDAGLNPQLQQIASLHPSKVVAIIEYPKGPMHGADIVRAMGNVWERVIRRAFPRKVKITKVQPRAWQSRMFASLPASMKDSTTKEKSIHRANRVAKFPTKDDNVADAVNLLEYLKSTTD